jgi:hypothetical protein
MNKISPSFTLKQCEELVKYYTPIIIGKEVEKDVKIETLEIFTSSNSENTVICRGKRKSQLDFRKDICLVALALKLTHPSEILKSQGL